MKEEVKLNTKIIEQHPNIVLVYLDDKNYAALEVTDASDMSEQDILQWKRDNPNYSVTEPCGKYFLLRIVECILENPPDTDRELAKMTLQYLKTGGEFWHDHYITSGN